MLTPITDRNLILPINLTYHFCIFPNLVQSTIPSFSLHTFHQFIINKLAYICTILHCSNYLCFYNQLSIEQQLLLWFHQSGTIFVFSHSYTRMVNGYLFACNCHFWVFTVLKDTTTTRNMIAKLSLTVCYSRLEHYHPSSPICLLFTPWQSLKKLNTCLSFFSTSYHFQ